MMRDRSRKLLSIVESTGFTPRRTAGYRVCIGSMWLNVAGGLLVPPAFSCKPSATGPLSPAHISIHMWALGRDWRPVWLVLMLGMLCWGGTCLTAQAKVCTRGLPCGLPVPVPCTTPTVKGSGSRAGHVLCQQTLQSVRSFLQRAVCMRNLLKEVMKDLPGCTNAMATSVRICCADLP